MKKNKKKAGPACGLDGSGGLSIGRVSVRARGSVDRSATAAREASCDEKCDGVKNGRLARGELMFLVKQLKRTARVRTKCTMGTQRSALQLTWTKKRRHGEIGVKLPASGSRPITAR